MTHLDETQCLTLVTEALFRRLRQEGGTAPRITPDADLVELGLVDSQALLDIILDVEQQSGALFNADRIDFESGMTLRHLAAAFADAG
jgi:acyl carrier protein